MPPAIERSACAKKSVLPSGVTNGQYPCAEQVAHIHHSLRSTGKYATHADRLTQQYAHVCIAGSGCIRIHRSDRIGRLPSIRGAPICAVFCRLPSAAIMTAGVSRVSTELSVCSTCAPATTLPTRCMDLRARIPPRHPPKSQSQKSERHRGTGRKAIAAICVRRGTEYTGYGIDEQIARCRIGIADRTASLHQRVHRTVVKCSHLHGCAMLRM